MKPMTLTNDEQNFFDAVKRRIEEILRELNLPVPKITVALETDKCDVTDLDHIRLNVRAAAGTELRYYALHVSGHYICGLEQTSLSDKVVDIIVELMKGNGIGAGSRRPIWKKGKP